MACRSREKTVPVVEQIQKETGNEKVEFAELDLLSLASVKAFATAFKARNLPLHILLNNAGKQF
jgi:NAD(P)-dependent dehydrogenase (short-subunit alcohol dehydrogenase family)